MKLVPWRNLCAVAGYRWMVGDHTAWSFSAWIRSPAPRPTPYPLSMPITADAVRDALATVEDPDLKRDLVSLGMIRDLEVDGTHIAFSVVLTTPACPLKELIRKNCIEAIHRDVNPDAEIEIDMQSDVTSPAQKAMMEGSGCSEVKNFIAVASGKGGVGKSTVATNLAVGLAKRGAAVGFLDADIYGPSAPLMFGVPVDERPRLTDERKIIPLERYGVKVLSMGFLVDDENAVIWRGPMVSRAVQQFLHDAEWGELDYLVIDLPPGTGDIQLTLVQQAPISGAIVVSTPQPVALADARKAVTMFRKTNVPVLGIVENMSFFTPPDLPDRKYYLFGEAGVQRVAVELELPVLGEIPIEQHVREGGDEGAPAVAHNADSPAGRAFLGMAEKTAQHLAIRNAEAPPTQPIEVLHR